MRPSRLDIAALCLLLATAVLAGWPIWTGGYLTYMDNPIHVAELVALADGEFWSDIGFCGFPLGYLHSPLWYRPLALLVHLGVPAGPLFGLWILFASLCPPVALYAVGRRRLPPLLALLPAWLFLVQRTVLVGYGSVFAGMTTFYISVGLLVVLLDLLARPERSWRQALYVSVCLSLLALTHLFGLVAAAVLIALHTARVLIVRPDGWQKMLRRESVAYGVAALCSSLYWYPTVRSLAVSTIYAQNLQPIPLLRRLLLPTDLVQGLQTDLLLVDAIPLLLLVAIGLLGVLCLRRWPNASSLYGALLVGGLAFLLFVVLPMSGSAWMGPNSWRYLLVLRVGLALASFPLLLALSRFAFVQRPRSLAAFAAVALLSVLVLGSPLRSQVGQPRGEAWDELNALWDHLRPLAGSPGRIFMQSTLMTAPLGHPFERSHIPALTAHETGIRQHGAYYGIVPYRTRFLTKGEFGHLLGLRIPFDFDREELRRRLSVTNTTRLVIADPVMADIVIDADFGEVSARFGRFTVIDLANPNHGWIGGDEGTVRLKRWDPGHVVFEFTAENYPATLLVKQAFDLGWESTPGVELSESQDSLMQLTIAEPIDGDIELRWRPYRGQDWMTASGCAVLLVWFLAIRRRDAARG